MKVVHRLKKPKMRNQEYDKLLMAPKVVWLKSILKPDPLSKQNTAAEAQEMMVAKNARVEKRHLKYDR